MSINLLDISKSYLKKPLLNKAADFLDEKSDFVTNSITPILSIIYGGLIQNIETPEEQTELFNQIKYSSFNSIKKFDEIFRGENSLVLDESHQILKKLFGKKIDTVSTILNKNSGIHKESANSLVKMVLSVVFKTVGNKIRENNLNVEQFSNLINTQKKHVVKSITKDFISKIINQLDLFSLDDDLDTVSFEEQKKQKGITDFQIAAACIALVSVLSLSYYFKNSEVKLEKPYNSFIAEDIRENTINDLNLFYKPTKNVLGKYIKNYEFLGEFTERLLPNNSKLIMLSNDGETQLLNFIESEKQVDKKSWFNFRRIAVNKATGVISGKSSHQIDNLVAILNAYPNVNIKIGGYTDNQGSALKNFNVSYQFAEDVTKEILKRGIDISRIRFEGYGENFPSNTNDTETGKRLNRRIAIRVSKK